MVFNKAQKNKGKQSMTPKTPQSFGKNKRMDMDTSGQKKNFNSSLKTPNTAKNTKDMHVSFKGLSDTPQNSAKGKHPPTPMPKKKDLSVFSGKKQKAMAEFQGMKDSPMKGKQSQKFNKGDSSAMQKFLDNLSDDDDDDDDDDEDDDLDSADEEKIKSDILAFKGKQMKNQKNKSGKNAQEEEDDDDDDDLDDDDDDDDDLESDSDEEDYSNKLQKLKQKLQPGNVLNAKQKTAMSNDASVAKKAKGQQAAESDDDDESDSSDENNLIAQKQSGEQNANKFQKQQAAQSKDSDDDDESTSDSDEKQQSLPVKGNASMNKQQKKSPQKTDSKGSPVKKSPILEAAVQLESAVRKQRDSRKLFVRGIPSDATAEELKALSPDVVNAYVPPSKRTNKARYGFLEFANEKKAEENLRLIKGKTLRGSELYVDFCGEKSAHYKSLLENQQASPLRINPTKLNMLDLPFDVTICQIANLFPKAVDIHMNINAHCRTATVGFKNEEDTYEAMKKNEKPKINGKAVSILFAKDARKKQSKKRKSESSSPFAKKPKLQEKSSQRQQAEDDDDDDDDDSD